MLDLYASLPAYQNQKRYRHKVTQFGWLMDVAQFWDPSTSFPTFTAMLSSTKFSLPPSRDTQNPTYWLTTFCQYFGTFGTPEATRKLLEIGDFEKSKFPKLLDLPMLGIGGGLSYCTNEKQTLKMVEGLDEGSLTKLEESALFETIYIW